MKTLLHFALVSALGASAFAQDPLAPAPPAPPASPETPAPPETLALVGGLLLMDPAAPALPGVVLIREGKIVAVGAEVEIPEGARREDVAGAIIAPAFLDAGCDGLIESEARRLTSGNADDRFADVLSNHEEALERRMLRAGIGAVYVDLAQAPSSEGSTSCLVILGKDPFARRMLDREAGLTFTLGSKGRDDATHLGHRAGRAALKGAFDGADRYKKAKKKYEDDQKAYEKKLAEWDAKHAKSDASDAKAGTKPAAEGEAQKPEGGRQRPRGRRPAESADKPAPPASGDAAKSDEKPKAPTEPTRDPGFETMLRILDRQAILRIEAHWKEDILMALEFARARKLRPIIMGASEGGQVIEELKEAKAVVVLGAPFALARKNPLDTGDVDLHRAQAFERAGIPIAFATAGEAGFGPESVALLAAWTQCVGITEAAAVRGLTEHAALATGSSERLGKLAVGFLSVLQIRKGGLLDPASRVQAMVLGQEVVRTPEIQP